MPAPQFPQINNGDSGLTVRTTLNQVIDTFGVDSTSSGSYSHAEGELTQAIGSYSHAEGSTTQATGYASHAEGGSTQAIGDYSHAEGESTKTGTQNAYYAESVSSGIITLSGSYGDISSQFNGDDRLYLYDTPFDQIYFKAIFLISQSYYSSPNTIVELYDTSVTTATAYVGSIGYGIVNWIGEQTIPGDYSHAEGNTTLAIGNYSHAEGDSTQALGEISHAEGGSTQAIGQYSHAEGSSAQAIGDYSHAEGIGAQALGQGSHAEGESIAIGYASHAEGNFTQAIGDYSHAEGYKSLAIGNSSHAEGGGDDIGGTATRAYGQLSHAEGYNTTTVGYASHAEGNSTIASGSYQHVSGQYNTHGDNTSLFIIGNGTADNARSDVFRVSGSTVQVTGSLIVTGSIIYLTADDFRVQYTNSTTSSIEVTSAGVSIFDTSNNIAGDFGNRILLDPAGNNSVDWTNRQLIKSDGTTAAFDWENGSMTGSLSVTGSQVYLTTDDFKVDNPLFAVSLIQAGTGGVFLNNNAGIYVVDVNNTFLLDSSNTNAIDWSSRYLIDSASVNSVDWNNRQLIKSDGTTVVFDWENGVVSSSLDISGSVTISDVLTLAPQDPLPSGVPTGSFAVSSSVPPKPYFWDGGAWNALY